MTNKSYHCSRFTDEAAVSQTCGDLSDGKPANWSVGGFLLKQKYIPIFTCLGVFLYESHTALTFLKSRKPT